MERHIPSNLLISLERRFSLGMNCVKSCDMWSSWFSEAVVYGNLFIAIYVDSLVDRVKLIGHGCYLHQSCINILLYAKSAKSGEQRHLLTAISLNINARTYRSA